MRDFEYERRLARQPRRSRRQAIRRWMIGCGLLILVAVIATAIGALYAISGQEHAPVLTGADHTRVATEVDKVMKTVEAVRRDAAKGVQRKFELTVSDEQLNLLLAEDKEVRRRLRSRHIEEAWVLIGDGEVRANAIRSMSGINVQIQATLKPEIAGGQTVHVSIVRLKVGRITMPPGAGQDLADELGRLVSSRITDTKARITEIKIADNRIELRGVTR